MNMETRIKYEKMTDAQLRDAAEFANSEANKYRGKGEYSIAVAFQNQAIEMYKVIVDRAKVALEVLNAR